MEGNELFEFRLALLEENQRDLTKAVAELTRTITVVRTWGAAGLLIHPLIVGAILKWAYV